MKPTYFSDSLPYGYVFSLYIPQIMPACKGCIDRYHSDHTHRTHGIDHMSPPSDCTCRLIKPLDSDGNRPYITAGNYRSYPTLPATTTFMPAMLPYPNNKYRPLLLHEMEMMCSLHDAMDIASEMVTVTRIHNDNTKIHKNIAQEVMQHIQTLGRRVFQRDDTSISLQASRASCILARRQASQSAGALMRHLRTVPEEGIPRNIFQVTSNLEVIHHGDGRPRGFDGQSHVLSRKIYSNHTAMPQRTSTKAQAPE